MFATLFLRSDCYDTVKYELEEFDPALDLLDSQDAEAANQHLSDVQTQDLHQQFRRDLKVFSLRTFKKKFRDSLGHHRTSVHRRFAYQTASQQLHPRHTGQRLYTQTFEGLSYKEAKKVMPSNVFLYRYEQYRRWVVNTGGIQRNGSWGVNRYFQRCSNCAAGHGHVFWIHKDWTCLTAPLPVFSLRGLSTPMQTRSSSRSPTSHFECWRKFGHLVGNCASGDFVSVLPQSVTIFQH